MRLASEAAKPVRPEARLEALQKPCVAGLDVSRGDLLMQFHAEKGGPGNDRNKGNIHKERPAFAK
jgi:hypothetical protein